MSEPRTTQFFDFADLLPLAVWVHGPDGSQVFVNRAYCELFGVSREEMRDEHWRDLVHPDDAIEYTAAFDTAVEGRRPFHAEVRVVDALGAYRWIESWAIPRIENGEYLGHIGTSADVTERHRAEGSLTSALDLERRARSRAEALEAMATRIASAATPEAIAAVVATAMEASDDDLVALVVTDGTRSRWFHGTARDDDERRDPAVANAIDAIVRTEVSVVDEVDDAGVVIVHPVPMPSPWNQSLLVVRSTDVASWDAERRASVAPIAPLVAGPLERALDHDRERAARSRAEFLAEIITEIEQCPTVPDQLVLFLELLVPRVADFATVESVERLGALVAHHRDPWGAALLEALRRRSAAPIDLGDDLAAVARLFVEHDSAGSEFDPSGDDPAHGPNSVPALRRALDVSSAVVVPLRIGEEQPAQLVLGLTDTSRRPYGEDDLAFFGEIARHVGSVMAATRAREREQLASLRLQKALLPDAVEAHDQLDVAAHYQAASEQVDVGGDWYDTFTWPGSDAYALVVGDVVGHGVEAAAAMGRIRAATELLVAEGPPDPVAILDAIDRATNHHTTTDYLTATVVVMDPEAGRLHYGSAGHPPPIVVRSDGSIRWLDDAAVGPICPVVTGPRLGGSIPFEEDDLVIAYSDGLIERRGSDIAAGLRLLAERVVELRTHGVDDVNRRLAAELGEDAEDDIVIASLRYAPRLRRHAEVLGSEFAAVADARGRLLGWLAELELDDELVERITLATAEALTNAVEHSGTAHGGGRTQLRATHDPERQMLTITVDDAGVWRRPRLAPINRGRGTTIMERVATSFDRSTGPGGTAVTMRFATGSA